MTKEYFKTTLLPVLINFALILTVCYLCALSLHVQPDYQYYGILRRISKSAPRIIVLSGLWTAFFPLLSLTFQQYLFKCAKFFVPLFCSYASVLILMILFPESFGFVNGMIFESAPLIYIIVNFSGTLIIAVVRFICFLFLYRTFKK